ncbi:MAG: STAS domain-containing protein [Planctomycetota bacterium]
MSTLPAQKKTPLVEIDLRPNLLYVRFIGPQVGQRESPIITQEVEPYFKQAGSSIKHFIIDLQSVTFMSSMGLGACIGLRNKAASAGAKPILYGTQPELLKLLAMVKMDMMFKLAKNQTELDLLLK